MYYSEHEELKRIKDSRSWRYTKPFRIIWDFFWRNIYFLKTLKENILVLLLNNSAKSIPSSEKTLRILLSKKKRAHKIQSILKLIYRHTSREVAPIGSPLVSIIIPCYEQIEYTLATIYSVLECGSAKLFEIIVADDCSVIDNYKTLNEVSSLIKVVRPDKNIGFLKNSNFAAAHASGEYLVFLNNDCLPHAGWLDSLIDTAINDCSIGIVGSKLLNSDGSLQEAGGIIWRDASGWNYGRGDNHLSPQYNYLKEVDYCTGASFCIKKSLWKEVGGFDDYFAPAYYEETDLSFRLREKNYKTIYQHKSVATHIEGISHGVTSNAGLKSYQIRNREKFINRWQHVLEKEHFPNGVAVFKARDRSKNKKHMLFIDHYIPRPDQDAGSKQMLSYLRLFSKEQFQVTFWACNQYYDPDYILEIELLGVEVITGICGPVDFSKWIQENGSFLDVAFLSRPHIAIKYFSDIRQYSACKIVFYGHDIHANRMKLQDQLVPGSLSVDAIDNIEKIEEKCWNESDAIFYPSIDEVEYLRSKYPGRTIEVLPLACMAATQISDSLTQNCFKEREGILFVGGFAHFPNRDGVNWFLDMVYPLVEKVLPEIIFTIAGSDPPQDIIVRSKKNIIVTGRISDEKLRALYNKSRIVIAPLRIGAGVKGKVVEALLMGVPVISTPIGIQGLPGSERVISVASSEEQFAEDIIKIYSDSKLWQNQREKGVMYFIENFSEHNVASSIMPLLCK